MEWVIALVTLTAMEIVLGIDNIVFISILCGKLPSAQRAMARTIGLGLAMGTRILLLLSLTWVLGLTQPIFYLTDLGIPASLVETEEQTKFRLATENDVESPAPSDDSLDSQEETDPHTEEGTLSHSSHGHDEHNINSVSWRDLILLLGGLFLIANSVVEIHHKIEGEGDSHSAQNTGNFWTVIVQIGILDIIFSLDSVITAIGMTDHINIMILAVIIAILVMMLFAGIIEGFVEKYPTIKILALSFLILIGVLLVAEGIGTPVNKGYIYFAMAFSLAVELVNMQIRGGRGVPTTSMELIDEDKDQ
ncbi:Integral membrane protein TerC family protein [Thalassoglobus neptunius]|uniref:Integral membrane protein TerC family protein n=1 Tax=Thalassoglobus neptunius TaxID=1938619 RepID=A0A5C5VQ67_9PLAN|nr:TerC family protein [Thalassoglobus neptunius]TWT40183.1 Integral membrane protein TerC family protein [Thalassoglobus neptunius]